VTLTVEDVLKDLKDATEDRIRHLNGIAEGLLLWWATIPEDEEITKELNKLEGYSEHAKNIIYEGLYCLAHKDEVSLNNYFFCMAPVAGTFGYYIMPGSEEFESDRSENADN
jgi:hypothetical protein